jgi:hypothetical protein
MAVVAWDGAEGAAGVEAEVVVTTSWRGTGGGGTGLGGGGSVESLLVAAGRSSGCSMGTATMTATRAVCAAIEMSAGRRLRERRRGVDSTNDSLNICGTSEGKVWMCAL